MLLGAKTYLNDRKMLAFMKCYLQHVERFNINYIIFNMSGKIGLTVYIHTAFTLHHTYMRRAENPRSSLNTVHKPPV